MAGTNFFQKMDADIMASLQHSVAGKMAEYSTMMSSLVGISISLYILWCGYLVFAGKLQRPIESVIWDLAKMGVILAFMMNMGGYLSLSIQAIDGLKNGFSLQGNIWQWLDELWFKGQQISAKLMQLDTSTYVKTDGVIGSALTWMGVIFSLVVAAMVFLIAEITILVLTTTAPIFIFCLMFGFLRTMFNNWLQAIFSSLITVLLGALVLSSGIQYLNGILSKIVLESSKGNIIVMGAMAGAAGFIAGVLVFKASSIAHQLAGVGVQGALEGAATVAAGVGMFGAAKALSGMAGMAKKGAGMEKSGFKEGFKGAERSEGSGRVGHVAGQATRAGISKAQAAVAKARAAGWARASGEQEKPRSIVPDRPKPITGVQWRSAPTVNSTPKIKE